MNAFENQLADSQSLPGQTVGSDGSPAHASAPARLLIVDDNQAIHKDFRKILSAASPAPNGLDEMEKSLFGELQTHCSPRRTFRIDSAFQGQEALALVEKAASEGDPYQLAFVDVRMPPGWDGIETLQHLWKASPELQAVLCTAYSDYSWDQITKELGSRDGLLILKKPFDTVEVLQLAHALTTKWMLGAQARLRMEDLDRMVEERTQKLRHETEARLKAEQQLRQAQKMEAIGCLAAGIAHEFNNLLTIIRGFAGLLRDRPDEPAFVSESSDRIVQASDRAAALTHQLLAYSRKQALHPKPINLSRMVLNLEPNLSQLVGENYTLSLQCPESLPSICGDEATLEQVLINLVLNARDAMPKGGQIRVCTEAAETNTASTAGGSDAPPSTGVCLNVSDHGCGIPPHLLNRIFDPFFTTKPVGKGTGLGLSTVQGIVRQHGGWIDVQSRPNEGSCFRVFFPSEPCRDHEPLVPIVNAGTTSVPEAEISIA